MKYYKLIDGQNIVGAATSLDLRRFQKKHRILLTCDEDLAQYIQCGDTLYHVDWLRPVDTDDVAFVSAIAVQIDEGEFNAISKAIDTGEEIPAETPAEEDPAPPEYIDQIDELTLEYVKDAKIREMSAACNRIIVDGFDVALSDGEVHRFSMSTQDQLNFITLATMVANGQKEIPYHANGELCKYYSAADMQMILDCATEFKLYHTTYFNSLREYIYSIGDVQSVSRIEYGVEIPEIYKSEVLLGLDANKEV